MVSVTGAQAGPGNAQCCPGTGWEARAVPRAGGFCPAGRQEGLSSLVSLKGSHLAAPPGFQLPFPKQRGRDEGVAGAAGFSGETCLWLERADKVQLRLAWFSNEGICLSPQATQAKRGLSGKYTGLVSFHCA